MPDAHELIGRLKNQRTAAFWMIPAVVLVLVILPAGFDLGGGFRWGLAILMLIVSLGLAVWSQASVGALCASLLETTQQGRAEDDKMRQQIADLQETCRQMEVEKKKAAEAPPVQKPGTPKVTDKKDEKTQELSERFRKSGRIDDLAALLESRA